MKIMNHLTPGRSMLMAVMLSAILICCKKEEDEKITTPILTTQDASDIKTMSAVGGGIITSDGGSAVTERGVCWGIAPNPTIEGAHSYDGSTGTGSFTSGIFWLSSGTVYHTRAYAINSAGVGYGADKTFTTSTETQTTVTLQSDALDTSRVRLNGIIYPNNFTVVVTFEYGLTESYGNTITAAESPISGNTEVLVSAEIGGLEPGVVYHYRVRSEYSSGGSETGFDVTFSPNGQMPVTESTGVTGIISASAIIHGTVNANYLLTVVSVEYGTTISYGNVKIVDQNPFTGNTPLNVSAQIEGLDPLIPYHFRLKAENSLGVSYSDDDTFTTQYTLGEHYFGGIIFYLDETGQHGIVCAEQNQGLYPWALEIYTTTGATATGIGTGISNTNMIVAAFGDGDYAAKICYDLVLNGYDDWFLPSQIEISMMRPYLDGSYNWSSSEIDTEHAWINYYNGDHYFIQGNKSGPWYVRAARAF